MSSRTLVLVVDDEPSIRNSLVEFLQDYQFDVLAADSAEGALGLIDRFPIDVAVVDIRLPRMDGDCLIAQARRIWPQIKFLVHTGSVDYKLPDELKKIGVAQEHVFPKPQADLSVFKDAIHKLMSTDA